MGMTLVGKECHIPFPFNKILLLRSSKKHKKSKVYAKTYKQYYYQLSPFDSIVSRYENCEMDLVDKKHLQYLINAKSDRLKFQEPTGARF